MTAERALMECRPIFHSCDVDETRAFLNPFGLRFDPVGSDGSPLNVHLNGAFLPGIYLGYVQYGSPAVVRMEADASYAIKLPTRGLLEAESRGEFLCCDTGTGVVLSPTRRHRLRSDGGGARLNIALRREAVIQQLAALLGVAPDGPLEFAAALDLTKGHGRYLASLARLAIAELEESDAVLSHPFAARAFLEFVSTALLLHQPHNYADALQRHDRPIAPRDVKRAIDYMEAHLGEASGLAEIVAGSGVPGRTLLKHFREFKQTSPMRYLRAARFERVRKALRDDAVAENITEIACRWGFCHMGRLSVEYHRRFAETPSETLRRRRSTPKEG